MKKILPFLLFWISIIGFAQCPNEEIFLETQADIDSFAANFPNCSILTNNLWIGGANNDITNLNGLSSITSAQNIYFRYVQMSDFSGLNNLEEVLHMSSWFSSNIQNLEGLTSLRFIERLHIFFSANITDLSGLDSIETIENLHIFSNQSLADISQLSFLETINSLTINNNALTSLNGLENIHTIVEDLSISNETLLDFNELSSLQTIGRSLQITNNTLVNDISAFSPITSLEELFIVDCPSLSNFSGLENIQNISGRLRIGFNTTLTDLSIFNNLNSVVDLDIYDNDNLESLSGLESLEVVSNRLFISRNISLSSIEAINDLSTSQISQVAVVNNTDLAACNNVFMCTVMADPTVVKSIFNNASGCNTIQEIEASCILAITDQALNEAITVYPNPVSEFLQVNVADGIGLESITVFSTLGQQLISSDKKGISFSSMSQGIYFVQVQTDHGSIIKRLIKR